MAVPHNEVIAADENDDTSAAVSVIACLDRREPNLTDSLTSLRSSVRQYQVENGRTYHAISAGKYAYPNDVAENDRLNLQHYVWVLTLRGALARCPKGDGQAKRVLDAGTGTGIWAIEYADLHPEAEVIGIDLSPIQPSLVPPNCSFEADDLEKEWAWSLPFDFIFGRVLAGSFQDYEEFINNAFANLEEGGYLEMQDFHPPYLSDDGTLTEEMELYKLGVYFREAGLRAGRRLDMAPEFKSMMTRAGFVDVVEEKYRWPLSKWPRDKYYKEIGEATFMNLDDGLEGLTLALFTRTLGWTPEETVAFCSKVRSQLRDLRIHAYLPIYVVYGRKPENVSKSE